MRLLVITQIVDRNDPVLGFFHHWINKLVPQFDQVTVIGLKVGEFDLPGVKVLSLGKESGRSRLKYLWRFKKYIWQERKNYDAVFVHMNQEYILLAGWWWRLMGKKVFMWRNHHAGSWLTDLAAWFCTKVFCTSKFSYTAKYKKTVLMPVGVDTDLFKPNLATARVPQSILFLARMAPVKKPDLLVKALKTLHDQRVDFTASFYGDAIPLDADYYQGIVEQVKSVGLSDRVRFYSGVPNQQTPAIYASHEIFVNLSSSGMYDKTIFEAMACETNIVASNDNLHGLVDEMHIFPDDELEVLVKKLKFFLNLDVAEKARRAKELRAITVEHHSLSRLVAKLKTEIS